MEKIEKETILFYKWVFFTTLLPHIATILHLPTIGMAWTGYAWSLMFLVSIFYLLKGKKIWMPVFPWLPWIMIVLIYCIFDFSYFGVQASCQYLSFIFVGFAASTLYYSDRVIQQIFKWFTYFSLYIIIGKLISMILPIPLVAGMATLVMTLCAISSVAIAVAITYRKNKYLIIYGVSILITAILVTRMGILMILVIGAFHFAFNKLKYKIPIMFIVAIAGVLIFNSEKFQKKAFGNKRVELKDLSISTEGGVEGINTNGREFMWMLMDKGIEKSPIFGHGARADLMLLKSAGLPFTECHNDYKAITYNYGYVGLSCLIFGFILQFILLYRTKRYIMELPSLVAYYASLTLFFVWIGFMYSDNIMKYATHFGNLHMCLIAIVYSRINSYNNYVINSNTTI